MYYHINQFNNSPGGKCNFSIKNFFLLNLNARSRLGGTNGTSEYTADSLVTWKRP